MLTGMYKNCKNSMQISIYFYLAILEIKYK